MSRIAPATLVVDTVGINANRPYPMVDLFGTPYTKALHVVERYRLVDYEIYHGVDQAEVLRWRASQVVRALGNAVTHKH